MSQQASTASEASRYNEESAKAEANLAPGLYLVATPIGNLEDITLRALRVLRSVDRIACEDTRQTQKLLNHFAIQKPTVSYHLHNEQGRVDPLVEELRKGGRVAVVTDAGMPGIADPGTILVRAAIEAGISVVPVPGANAALTALIASGLDAELFTFHGFLPSKEGQRRTALEKLRGHMANDADAVATHIFYETPHRILQSLMDLEAIFGPDQQVVLARELTKVHEEFLRGSVRQVASELQKRPVIRGEMVLLLEVKRRPNADSGPGLELQTLADEVTAAIKGGLSEKDALKQVARHRGVGKSELYREWQRGRKR